jgi:hypothetical protein
MRGGNFFCIPYPLVPYTINKTCFLDIKTLMACLVAWVLEGIEEHIKVCLGAVGIGMIGEARIPTPSNPL